MNNIHHKQIIIDMDVWEPFAKECMADIDALLSDIKTKKHLSHCGNVKSVFKED